MPYVNIKDADQPAYPRSLINVFVVRGMDDIIPIVGVSSISRLWLASVAEQAGSSLTWLHTLKTGFLMTRFIYFNSIVSLER